MIAYFSTFLAYRGRYVVFLRVLCLFNKLAYTLVFLWRETFFCDVTPIPPALARVSESHFFSGWGSVFRFCFQNFLAFILIFNTLQEN